MDMFGRDSDTTSDGEDDDINHVGAQDVQPAAEAVESHPPPPAVGRALFARAVSDDDTDAGDAVDGGGETKGEDPQPPPPHPQPPPAAQPVKTLPRPAYEGDKNALINLCNYGGSGAVNEARDLIARGINIDEQDENGKTALMRAAAYNRLEIAQELIRAGAALDVQGSDGWTALMRAVSFNSLEIVQELVRAGAALDLQDKDGETALQIARNNGLTKIATVLEEAAVEAAAGSVNEVDECVEEGKAREREKDGDPQSSEPPLPLPQRVQRPGTGCALYALGMVMDYWHSVDATRCASSVRAVCLCVCV